MYYVRNANTYRSVISNMFQFATQYKLIRILIKQSIEVSIPIFTAHEGLNE